MNGVTKAAQQELLNALLSDPGFFGDVVASVEPSDFEMPQVRLVYEIAKWYHQTYGEPPAPSVITNEVLGYVKDSQESGGSEKYSTVVNIDDEDGYNYLIEVVQAAEEKLEKPSSSGSKYWRDFLPEYLKAIRQARVRTEGLGFDDEKAALDRIGEQVGRLYGSGINMVSAMKEIDDEEAVVETQVCTGIVALDAMTESCLDTREGPLALLAAGTGVGKTVGMANFAVANALRGLHSLYITLEVSEKAIRQSVQAMMAFVDPDWLRRPKKDRPDDINCRLKYITGPDFHAAGISIVDHSKTFATVADIDAAIGKWAKSCVDAGIQESDRPVVFIDYLNIIASDGLPGITKNSRRDEVIVELAKALQKIAKKYKVVIWTAQQLKDEARGKEVIKISDIAYASHLSDWLTLCVGLAPQASTITASAKNSLEENASSEKPKLDRVMKLSVMKSRNSAATGQVITFYQGYTLKFWTSKSYMLKVEPYAKSGNVDKLFSMMTTHARRANEQR